MSYFSSKLGVDLGTSEIVFYKHGKGVVLREPTAVAISNIDRKIMCFGQEAKDMMGKMPDSVSLVRPIKNSVINDYKITVKMLTFFLNKVLGIYGFIKPEIVVSVPSSITGTEKRAVVEAFLESGAKNVYTVKEPVLAAIGSGIPIQEPVGRMVVKVGAGTTDIAVISLGGVVFSKSIKLAGNKMDESIIQMAKDKHGIIIGERSAEMIKIAIGGAMTSKEEKGVRVRGRDFETGQPREITMHKNEVVDALQKDLDAITACAREVFSETPPELSSDIMDNGILLCGNSAYLTELGEFFQKYLNIPTTVAEEPKLCVSIGLGIVLGNMDNYKRAMVSK